MTDPSDDLPTTPARHHGVDPKHYRSTKAKARFAIAKYYGMGSDGEWSVEEIADALDVGTRRVYQLLNDTGIGEDVREMLATTEAEWRLDMALQLRKEVARLESIEQELLERKQAVATNFESKEVTGTPTGDRNIALPEHKDTYKLRIPVPIDYEVVTDYGPDLERVQKEKRQYLAQIAKLLGLNAADKKEIDMAMASRHEEVKVLEMREVDDDYPDAEPIDVSDGSTVIDVENVREPVEATVEEGDDD